MNKNHKQLPVKINNTICMIDIRCIKLVQLFNNIGLTTKYSCQGNGIGDYEIMFEDNISDKDITNFLIKFSKKYDHTPFCGYFMKWGRKVSGNIQFNWMYINSNSDFADIDYELISKLNN